MLEGKGTTEFPEQPHGPLKRHGLRTCSPLARLARAMAPKNGAFYVTFLNSSGFTRSLRSVYFLCLTTSALCSNFRPTGSWQALTRERAWAGRRGALVVQRAIAVPLPLPVLQPIAPPEVLVPLPGIPTWLKDTFGHGRWGAAFGAASRRQLSKTHPLLFDGLSHR